MTLLYCTSKCPSMETPSHDMAICWTARKMTMNRAKARNRYAGFFCMARLKMMLPTTQSIANPATRQTARHCQSGQPSSFGIS